MDQGPLVDYQRDDGQLLLNRLVEAGVPINAACWLKESEYGEWFLYIATPLVSERGSAMKAYGAIGSVLRQLPQFSGIFSLSIKAVSAGSPIAKAVHEMHQRYPGRTALPYRETRFGDINIEGGYVYPPIPAPVQ